MCCYDTKGFVDLLFLVEQSNYRSMKSGILLLLSHDPLYNILAGLKTRIKGISSLFGNNKNVTLTSQVLPKTNQFLVAKSNTGRKKSFPSQFSSVGLERDFVQSTVV